ncbi:hypothetical protein NUW58_g6064 [Xylaria curta]|uniref:Uncharacterized protein n=1 Tax=Xylaria curta TaxID=42375 RepID=A0ACC1NYP6_9PEZI|nr:hypothetical protein NUW58_g6064 [Xylaria curta]
MSSTSHRGLSVPKVQKRRVTPTYQAAHKVISLGTLSSGGYRRVRVYGHRAVSNMLEELTYSAERGDRASIIDGTILCESPLERIQRYIKERFWVSLTRFLDAETIELAVKDTKIPGWGGTPIIYVPHTAEKQLAYYSAIAAQRPSLGLQVIPLPAEVTKEAYIKILKNPGILALDTEEYVDPITGLTESRAVPFVVPGGRFNEFFGWDSYFMGLGLLRDGRVDLVRGVLRNWVFEIQYYGMIPNANRSYLMLRSQPPFLTDLSLQLYEATKHEAGAKDLLRLCIQAAIKEYHRVWTCHPRLDDATGLSKYCPVGGFGIPNEVEPGHFDSVLRPIAETAWAKPEARRWRVARCGGRPTSTEPERTLFERRYNDVSAVGRVSRKTEWTQSQSQSVPIPAQGVPRWNRSKEEARQTPYTDVIRALFSLAQVAKTAPWLAEVWNAASESSAAW